MPTADGVLWFKENPAGNAFEPALTALVACVRPDAVPEVVAHEGPRLLTRDVGPRLRDILDAGAAEPSWEDVLALYGELHADLAGMAEEALALGAPDERPARLPQLYEEIAGRDEQYGRVVEAAQALGETVPVGVVHQEAHDGNVFVRGGRPVFIDWAEASVTHPFLGPLLPLRFATERAGHEPGSREVERLRDAYLEPFTRFAPAAELRRAFAHAYLLAPIGRAQVWHRILGPLAGEVSAAHGDPVSAWIEILGGIAQGELLLGAA
ncbi:MAG TPA: phosphotransferase [Gaiellaceae bacterium]|nr:phosphotransferase [Gaiellaceae bacterium]